MSSWYKLYNFDDNKERTKKILEKFGIEKYHFVTIQGETALIIDINLNNYRLELFDGEMAIRKKKYTRKASRHKKEYLEIVKSFDNDCIYNALKFCAIDSGIYRT